jgi:predicted SAM-dependent methyltransferase
VKLDIGSGTNPYGNGYLTVDPWQADADIVAPMQKLPVPDGVVDAIYCSHALEHVGWRELPAVLAEWRRVLVRGGELLLRVPDLRWCVLHWLEHPHDVWRLAKIFGSQEHEGNVHRSGFDATGWRNLLGEGGFTVQREAVLWTHEQQTLEYLCTRS